MAPAPRRPLFERLPNLREQVPWAPLADGLPTPLEHVDDNLWVKRDDQTSSLYGGNKVRKLEFILAQAAERGGPVVTAGAVGSHFAVATATHAQKLSVPVEVVRFPQPMTPHVQEVADRFATLPAHGVRAANPYVFPLVQAQRWWARRRDGALFVPGGGSSPFGALGYVNAGLELVEDHQREGLGEPDEVVVAASTCGTAVGLSLGLALAGWQQAVVVAVRVADLALTNPLWVGQLRTRTERVLRRAGSRELSPRLLVDGRWLGPGYGHTTPEGERAAEVAAGYGLSMEPTYTAKAFAAVLDRRWPGKRIVYIHTFAG